MKGLEGRVRSRVEKYDRTKERGHSEGVESRGISIRRRGRWGGKKGGESRRNMEGE